MVCGVIDHKVLNGVAALPGRLLIGTVILRGDDSILRAGDQDLRNSQWEKLDRRSLLVMILHLLGQAAQKPACNTAPGRVHAAKMEGRIR